MSEQPQPLVSVGSNNRVGNRNHIFIGVFVFSIASCILLGYALWPYLHAIGLALTLLMYVLIGVIGILVAYIPIYLIRRGETDLAHRRAIAGFVSLGEHGGYRLSQDGSEPLHPPFLLSSPVQVTAVEEDEKQDVDNLRILELAEHGWSQQKIADETGMKKWKVQQIIAAWKKQHGFVD